MGDGAADVSWLSGRLGDVYPHETATTHGRRLLSHNPPCALTGETLAQFSGRLGRVEEHMNSADSGRDAESLLRVSQCMRARCQMVIDPEVERIPK